MKKIYVNSETLNEAVSYLNDDITFFGFLSHAKSFLKNLLKSPSDANVDDYLKKNGLNRKDLINKMIERGIIEKETEINERENDDKFLISYKIPKKNFERKMKRLYSSLFDDTDNKINEDCASGGATGGGATGCCNALTGTGNVFNSENDADGTYDVKLGNVQRRKIHVTEAQYKMLKEMGTVDAGNYQYDVPLKFNNGNDPAYDHKNMMAKSFPNKKKGIRYKNK